MTELNPELFKKIITLPDEIIAKILTFLVQESRKSRQKIYNTAKSLKKTSVDDFYPLNNLLEAISTFENHFTHFEIQKLLQTHNQKIWSDFIFLPSQIETYGIKAFNLSLALFGHQSNYQKHRTSCKSSSAKNSSPSFIQTFWPHRFPLVFPKICDHFLNYFPESTINSISITLSFDKISAENLQIFLFMLLSRSYQGQSIRRIRYKYPQIRNRKYQDHYFSNISDERALKFLSQAVRKVVFNDCSRMTKFSKWQKMNSVLNRVAPEHPEEVNQATDSGFVKILNHLFPNLKTLKINSRFFNQQDLKQFVFKNECGKKETRIETIDYHQIPAVG